MRLGHVQCGEIVPARFDLGSSRDGKAQIRENLGQLVHHLRDRVHRALGRGRDRQREVDRFGGEPFVERRAFQRVLARGDRGGDSFARAVDARALFLALFGAHAAQRLEQPGDRALLAQSCDADVFQRGKIGSGDARQIILLQLFNIGHGPVFHICEKNVREPLSCPAAQIKPRRVSIAFSCVRLQCYPAPRPDTEPAP